MSHTIQIGIDLGTTNSAIVIQSNGKYEIIKNSDQMEYTPSVFGFLGDSPQVGDKAYRKLFQFSSGENVQNYKAEIKRLMGTNEKITFQKAGITLSPEEISAEILKYLKQSVIRKYPDFPTNAVIITVPAYFDTIQKEATKRAGELAGFDYTVLLQEPIAAAVAYGFENRVNENWLVYDLGGGTFDVSIISSKDGVLTVKGHGGDNYLGGKDFDEAIVDNIIIPEIASHFHSGTLSRSNPQRKGLYNHLKYLAEVAKKELTDTENVNIILEEIIADDNEKFDIIIPFSRQQFESTIEKYVNRTIEISKTALQESGFSSGDIAKIILVGGSTMSPYIRERLEKDMGINVDASLDPLTVVAKGACIFGNSQVIPTSLLPSKNDEKIGSLDLELNYESMTSEDDMIVTGSLLGTFPDKEYFIQIQSEDGQFSGNKIKLKNGKFHDTVLIGKDKTNTYFLYLSDASGNIIPTNPEFFHITHGISIAGTPLSHSVGVSLSKKVFMGGKVEEYMDVIFTRGSILPLKGMRTYRTVRTLKKGDSENALPIKIYEGESEIPKRNILIAELILNGSEIPYNLPEGTEVNLIVEINASGEIQLAVFIPSISMHKEGTALRTINEQEQYSSDSMQQEVQESRERLKDISDHIPLNKKKEIEDEMDILSQQAEGSETDTRKTNVKIKELQRKLDDLEAGSKHDRLSKDFVEKLEQATLNYPMNTHPIEYKQIQSLKEEGESALQNNDYQKLEVVIDKIDGLNAKNILNSLENLTALIAHFYEQSNKSKDPIKTAEIIQRAVKFIEEKNVEGVRQCFFELRDLMSDNTDTNISHISGISK